MRARISGGFFILGVLLLTVDPLAGQPGGGRFGKGGFGPPGTTPGLPGATPVQPGGFPTQPGSPPGGMRYQFQPGGGGFQPGGGFSRGGGMDPEAQWQMMLKLTGGTDTVDFSRVPPDTQKMIRGMSERMGTQPLPESGVWSKGQFIDFATRNQEIVRARTAGGQPGAAPGAPPVMQYGPGGQPGGYGQPGGFQMQPGQFGPPGGKGMSDEDAVRRFRDSDKDQDGKLSPEEASRTTRENWQEVDVNRDNFVDLDEYRGYIARRFGPNAQQNQPGLPMQPGYGQPQFGGDFRGTGEGGPPGFGGPGRRDEKKDDFTNVAIRFGKLPPGLPDWFAEYDQDKDGQVNMYEWRTVGGKAVAEFRDLDANGDGFIAPQELIRVTATKAETERLMAIQDGETPQGTGQSRGKGGSSGRPSFGGGPPMTGKGGQTPEARPSRDEKREEKADRGKAGPWGNAGKK